MLLVITGIVLIVFFVPYSTAPIGGTNNLVVCPIWFIANYSAAPCGVLPFEWPSGDSLAASCSRRA